MTRVESFPPIVSDNSKVLILGSMPGEASLKAGQYYAHPRNAFWPIMGALFGAAPSLPYEIRVARLQAAGVALWDSLKACVRPGSLDTSITEEVGNDFPALFASYPRIAHVYFNGSKAEAAFRRHALPLLPNGSHVLTRLPSTSPAHAAMPLDAKVRAWSVMLKALAPCLALACVCAIAQPACGQTDEIQVYTGEINEPGQFSVTLHNNYTPDGRKEPDFPGGVVPDHAWNGVPEYAYGVNEWWELGAYLPVYTLARDGRPELDSVKLRTLFAMPHANERSFFYAVNFELSYNARHWEPTRFSAEMRPIVGVRFGPVDLIANPIVDFSFEGLGSLDIAPAERIAYNFSELWAVAVEHYADYGQARHLEGANGQLHELFGVVDYNGDRVQVEFGLGHGFTAASDDLVIKLMLTRVF